MKDFSISGYIIDAFNKEIFKGELIVVNGFIIDIIPKDQVEDQYIMPGLIDSHIHIESSMLLPAEFARIAVKHGTTAVVADPHEIANVLGVKGIDFMIQNANEAPMHFFFGAPSCVPASEFVSAGAKLDEYEVNKLLLRNDIYFLAEVMDFPGVINGRSDILSKIESAKSINKPIDGHAPGLMGNELSAYIERGIGTDHESFSLDEAREKIHLGMKIMIREGSAAKNFTPLANLIDIYPNHVMLCSDDLHPDDLLKGHINLLFKRAMFNEYDLFNIIKVACINPVLHYNLPVGLLRINDPADFIVIDDPARFNILKTVVNGEVVFDSKLPSIDFFKQVSSINIFRSEAICIDDIFLQFPKEQFNLNIIQLVENQLLTKHLKLNFTGDKSFQMQAFQQDVLKIICLNRYNSSKPAVAFVKGFNLKKGAIASSIAHDSHNIIAVGTNDLDIVEAINTLIAAKGGISVAENGIFDCLPLPIAGIMSSQRAEKVASDYEYFNQAAINLGTLLSAPFMTLSFLALPVIPELKITDKGLFNVLSNQYIDLIEDE